MAEEMPQPALPTSHANMQYPPPASSAGSHHGNSTPFTPRSSIVPDGLDSDSEFDAFDPTPVHSPTGPHYDDLPPSYDEAQQQAVQEARSRAPSLDPNNLQVHQMVLNNLAAPPPSSPNTQQQPSRTSVVNNPHAYGFEPEDCRNARGLGRTVPVQAVESSERIPVGRVNSLGGSLPAYGVSAAPPVDISVLVDRALEFTKHEPDADTRYVPRLVRPVAIPQESVPCSGRPEHREGGRRHGRARGERGRRRGSHDTPHSPVQGHEAASSSVLDAEAGRAEEPVQFLRSYAKALHAHSIRPSEFTDFIDGLNALCAATQTTSSDLADTNPPDDTLSFVVGEYIDRANAAFFAPRGLSVGIQTLDRLVEGLDIPERGQRAAAVAIALDAESTSEQKAMAVHLWGEMLETDVPGVSARMVVVREMGERFKRQSQGGTAGKNQHREQGRTQVQNEAQDDPPHSIPEELSGPNDTGNPPFPFGRWGPGRHGRPGGPGISGISGIPGIPSVPGAGPWGIPQGPWDRGGHGHQYRHTRGLGGPGFPGIPRGFGPSGPGYGNTNANTWAAIGKSWGKWGEEFGKSMGEWGTDLGRQLAVGPGINFSGAWGRGQSIAHSQPPSRSQAAAGPGPGVASRQEMGVHEQDSAFKPPQPQPMVEEKKKMKKGKSKTEHDESESSDSDSSDSDSSDSDSDWDDEDEPTPHDIFLSRIRSIDTAAQASTAKGKKSAEEIASERALAIEKAQKDKTAMELKYEQKGEKRALKKQLRARKREIKREHKRVKRELKELDKKDGGGEKGKRGAKDKAGKREERRKVREKYREEKREVRRLKGEKRREWREGKRERRRERWEHPVVEERAKRMVWVVVGNLEGA